MTGSFVRIVLVGAGLIGGCTEPASSGLLERSPRTGPPALAPAPAGLPMLRGGFVENVGQAADAALRFYAFAGPMTVGLTEGALLFKVADRSGAAESGRGAMIRQSFVRARATSARGDSVLPGRHHYFIGGEPKRWRTNVRRFGNVIYEDLYPGVDLVVSAQVAGVKYEFRLDAGVDPGVIRWMYEGIDGIRLDEAGGLVIRTAAGEVRDQPPISWQEGEPVSCHVVLLGPSEAGFRCERTDPGLPLVIDPLVYATFLGGGRLDGIRDIETDPLGYATVTGHTEEAVPTFPTTPGAFQEEAPGGGVDAFVARLSPSGDLDYATFLGGASEEGGQALALDPSGSVVVMGGTTSSDFPVTAGAYDTENESTSEFVTRIAADGSALEWSTFLGGGGRHGSPSVALNAQGDAFLAFRMDATSSGAATPTPGAFDVTPNDTFVVKLSSDGASALYATFLGGSGLDAPTDIAVDAAGAAYVVGDTQSEDFPVTPVALQPTYGGNDDGFIAKLTPAGDALEWASYVGGEAPDGARAVAVDAESVFVGGHTGGLAVTADALDGTLGGTDDGFVARIRADGQALMYATYVGGGGFDVVFDMNLDGLGRVYLAGRTQSGDFPVSWDAFDVTGPSGVEDDRSDAFVARLDAAASMVTYATYLGGSRHDAAVGVSFDSAGAMYVVGFTESPDFPTTEGAFGGVLSGPGDGFVAKLTADEPAAEVLDCGGAMASVGTLWPPNHGLIAVTIAGIAGASSVEVTQVSQDEPTDDIGDGATCPDATIHAGGTAALRAERSGRGNGRVYHVGFGARGVAGEACAGSVAVCVPHDQADADCVDEGPTYDSLACGP